MADLTQMFKWNNSETAVKSASLGSTAGYVTFRDEDISEPNRLKRVYSVRMTYKNGTAVAKNAAVYYVVDGGTTFINTVVPAANLNSTATIWNTDDIILSTFLSVSSIRFKVITGWAAGVSGINNFSVELRPVYKRVT